jgi:hypothetical protein
VAIFATYLRVLVSVLPLQKPPSTTRVSLCHRLRLFFFVCSRRDAASHQRLFPFMWAEFRCSDGYLFRSTCTPPRSTASVQLCFCAKNSKLSLSTGNPMVVRTPSRALSQSLAITQGRGKLLLNAHHSANHFPTENLSHCRWVIAMCASNPWTLS